MNDSIFRYSDVELDLDKLSLAFVSEYNEVTIVIDKVAARLPFVGSAARDQFMSDLEHDWRKWKENKRYLK